MSSNIDHLSSDRRDLRQRIIDAAIILLQEGGRDALTTRAVAAAADVQPPTLYRLFGDKQGLLEAVIEFGFVTTFNQQMTRKPGADPVDDLRSGWDMHVRFGLENPAIYALMTGDPKPGFSSPTAEKCRQNLYIYIRRIAKAGRLRVSEKRAVELEYAFCSGTVLSLLALPADQRDPDVAMNAREALIAAITTDAPTPQVPLIQSASITLREELPNLKLLSDGERHLLGELLDRINLIR